ncbi:hypothetical protein GBAR_LOCUS29483 [Geodia barretti]|uniref:Uncharacterized protein n=1 Tax=Geodia barretti TaxID=519541 RepID=A0AA35XK29_GEOBA|nr:hypothetical protein GBAR_LOCUS29483 [Geodia barretti]
MAIGTSHTAQRSRALMVKGRQSPKSKTILPVQLR